VGKPRSEKVRDTCTIFLANCSPRQEARRPDYSAMYSSILPYIHHYGSFLPKAGGSHWFCQPDELLAATLVTTEASVSTRSKAHVNL
jgi:hypothetical protein